MFSRKRKKKNVVKTQRHTTYTNDYILYIYKRLYFVYYNWLYSVNNYVNTCKLHIILTCHFHSTITFIDTCSFHRHHPNCVPLPLSFSLSLFSFSHLSNFFSEHEESDHVVHSQCLDNLSTIIPTFFVLSTLHAILIIHPKNKKNKKSKKKQGKDVIFMPSHYTPPSDNKILCLHLHHHAFTPSFW